MPSETWASLYNAWELASVTILLILATMLAWGVWLLPAERAVSRDPAVVMFYATAANLVLAAIVADGLHPPSLPAAAAIVGGGLLWSVAGWCAVFANSRLGFARATSFRTPVNVLTALTAGGIVFEEFARFSWTQYLILAAAVTLLLLGLALVIGRPNSKLSARGPRSPLAAGWLAAAIAGLIWGSYFVPVRAVGVAPGVASLPLALGMFLGATAIVAMARRRLRLPAIRDYLLLPACGLLWAAGNYASLALIPRLGVGGAFSVAQLCLVVSALAGVYYLREPPPGSPMARRILWGCALALAGGAAIGWVT